MERGKPSQFFSKKIFCLESSPGKYRSIAYWKAKFEAKFLPEILTTLAKNCKKLSKNHSNRHGAAISVHSSTDCVPFHYIHAFIAKFKQNKRIQAILIFFNFLP